MKADKPAGLDGIGNKVLKMTSETSAIYLTELFNHSLKTETVPRIWKQANVSPIYKKGERASPENYRPVSLLPCVSKAMERCIHNHMMSFLEENNLLVPNQSAFRANRSTVTQLLELVDALGRTLDKQEIAKVPFCDLSKAFDRVWHNGLLQKLELKGITGPLLRWIKDYLSNRYQRWRRIRAGVPQGSIMGPLLFLVFVDDVINELYSNPRIFADDILSMATGKDQQECCEKLQADLTSIDAWATKWKMGLNAKKTVCLTVTRQAEPVIYLNINGEIITEVSAHKHLGLTLEKDLKWREHVRNITSRAEHRLAILKSYSNRFSRETLLLLYTVYIRPILEYANVVWCNTTMAENERLEDINRSGLRTAMGAKLGTSHAFLYDETCVDTLARRKFLHQIVMMHRIVNNTRPGQLGLQDLQQVSHRNRYNVRNTGKLSVIMCITAQYQSSFLPTGVNIWNNTSVEMKNCEDIAKVKFLLKNKTKPCVLYSTSFSRRANILMSRLRCLKNDLRKYLYEVGLCEIEICECGEATETITHYLMFCPNYEQLRTHITDVIPLECWITRTVLYGSDRYSLELNQLINLTGQKFIMDSKRFK